MTNQELRREHRVSISSDVRAQYNSRGKTGLYEVDVLRADNRRQWTTGRVVGIGVGKTEAEVRAHARIIANAIAQDRGKQRQARKKK